MSPLPAARAPWLRSTNRGLRTLSQAKSSVLHSGPVVSDGNLPLAVSSCFTGDEMALLLGTCLPFPAAFCDAESGTILGLNEQFLRLIDATVTDFEQRPWHWSRIVRVIEPSVVDAFLQRDEPGLDLTVSGEILRPHGEDLSAEFRFRRVRWKQRALVVVYARDCGHESSVLERLRREVEEQKGRASAAIQSSLRVYHLSEKIKWTPVITRDLLGAANENELFADAARILTQTTSLGYREVTFYLLAGDELRVAYSTREVEPVPVPLADTPVLREFLFGDVAVGEHEGRMIVRLTCHGNLLGFCEVLPYEQEREYFTSLGRVSELQKDFLGALGDIIGLLIENLRLSREIKRQSIIDPLTGTFNRRQFMVRLHAEVERSIRYARDVSLVFVDLDSFKQVNDAHGHLQGDQVLKEIAAVLAETFRETDVVCRYGGDEFVILLPETDAAMARKAADKLVESVARYPFSVSELEGEDGTTVTVSVGVSTLLADQDENDLLQSADIALFKAKRQGKNRVASYP